MPLSILGFAISWPLVWTLVALILGREIWNLTYFRRHGVKGPMPLPFVGNVLQWLSGFHNKTLEYREQFGKVVGVYLFSQPVMIVSDLEMVKDIAVKHFSKFMNHKPFVLKCRPFHKSVMVLRDQRWKDVRNVITPTFSAAKMKQMSSLVNECCDNLVKNFGETQQKDNQVKLFSNFETFTMDGICKCAFGLQIDSQNNPNDPFVTHAKMIMESQKLSPTLMIAGMCRPIGLVMDYFEVSTVPSGVIRFFTAVIDKTIELRKQSGDSNRKDFLQLLMNVEKENQEEKRLEEAIEEKELHSLAQENHDESYFDLKQTKETTLSREEIYGQTMLFFFAGYETTNITLGFMSYSLATNSEVQDKLIQEIDELAPTRDSVNYNSISAMSYLDCVVCETLRLYPPAVVTERECNETYTNGDTTIPKGFQVFIPVFDIHRNSEFWPNPLEFDPNRFTKENRVGRHPFAWIPFGAGPRNCIGMRFALMEIKMAIVRLLQTYRFETAPDTEIPLKLGTMKIKPEKDIIIRVVERN